VGLAFSLSLSDRRHPVRRADKVEPVVSPWRMVQGGSPGSSTKNSVAFSAEGGLDGCDDVLVVGFGAGTEAGDGLTIAADQKLFEIP
jgi:hypothetical protein